MASTHRAEPAHPAVAAAQPRHHEGLLVGFGYFAAVNGFEGPSDSRFDWDNSVWRPSPGTVYPTIAQLEDEGLVSVVADAGRKLVTLTEAGRTEQ